MVRHLKWDTLGYPIVRSPEGVISLRITSISNTLKATIRKKLAKHQKGMQKKAKKLMMGTKDSGGKPTYWVGTFPLCTNYADRPRKYVALDAESDMEAGELYEGSVAGSDDTDPSLDKADSADIARIIEAPPVGAGADGKTVL